MTDWFHGYVLAVDPGGTTGWVLMADETGHVMSWGEEPDRKKFLDFVWDLLMADALFGIVCERWVTMRGRAFTNEPTAQEIIGALRWMSEYTDTVFKEQGAADAKAFGGKDALAAYPEVGKGGAGHAKMALRHALLYRATTLQGKRLT